MSNLPKRFANKIREASDGCWHWTGATYANGYGHVWTKDGDRAAHRVIYEFTRGPIPPGAELDHLCRVRHCVNPEHVEPVSRGENVRRGLRGYGARTMCRQGMHDITDPENVLVRPDGQRQCHPCVRAAWKRAWARKKARRLLATGRVTVTPDGGAS